MKKTLNEGTHFEDPCRRKINLYLQGGEFYRGSFEEKPCTAK
jgi:hypothetical protein